jgi:simple sugar transport system permease protein
MSKILKGSKPTILLPALAFIFAFFIGGILIVLADPEVMGQISSPLNFLTAAAAKIGNSYLAIFQGSVFDVNLARESGLINGFYPFSETLVTATPLILLLGQAFSILEHKVNLFLGQLVLHISDFSLNYHHYFILVWH